MDTLQKKLVLSKKYSSEPADDKFEVTPDDTTLIGDGADATRLVFRVLDKYGQPRAYGGGIVKFSLVGPGILVGDNPFDLSLSGGAAAVWIKSQTLFPGSKDVIKVTTTHSSLGSFTVLISVTGP